MYNYDITSIVKCHHVQEDKLRHAEVMYIDFHYDGKIDTQQNQYPTAIGPKVYTKQLKDETIKRGIMSNTNKIFEEVLDKYYKMHKENILQDKVEGNDTPKYYYNINDDVKNLIYKCMMYSRIIAAECRIGMANVVIVPDIKYEKILKPAFTNNAKIIINPTDIHKDKIFLLRVESELSNPGLSLFVSKNIVTDRYMKLVKIMEKMGRQIDDLSFSYILTDVGLNANKFVRCIYLTEN